MSTWRSHSHPVDYQGGRMHIPTTPTPVQRARLHRPWSSADVVAVDAAALEAVRQRCQALLAGLGRGSYVRGWLPEATDGELSACLARCCAQLWVTPAGGDAAVRIGMRCAHLPNVAIDVSGAARAAQGTFDLIVVSG